LETFNFVKRGYNPEEVDAYINTLEQVIKSYKDKDNAIKNAIISAQVAADNIIKNAQAQSVEYRQSIRKQLQTVKDLIARQRSEVKNFQEMYQQLIRRYLTEIESGEIDALMDKLGEVDALVDSLDYEAESEKPIKITPSDILHDNVFDLGPVSE